MKKLLLCAVVFLSGCANFDANRFAQFMNQSIQSTNDYVQSRQQPYTLPPPQMAQPQKPMVMPGNLKNNYVNGFIRYCVYSNGVVTSISNIDFCPLTNP